MSKREFKSGANRNSDEGKLDFEGFLSPTVLEAYAEYMNRNRSLEDGTLRDSDNWQKGIPKSAYIKSMWRHFFDTWKSYRGLKTPEDQISNLCGLLFNVSGMLHEELKEIQEANFKGHMHGSVWMEEVTDIPKGLAMVDGKLVIPKSNTNILNVKKYG